MSNAAEKIDQEEQPRRRPQFKAGHYPDLSNEDYHSSAGYSSSSLKVLTEKTKAHLDYQRTQPSEYTDATLKGDVLHTLALEPHELESKFYVQPAGVEKPSIRVINAKKPSPASEVNIAKWNDLLDKANGRQLVKEQVFDHANAMATKVRNHPQAGMFVQDGLVEQSVYYWYNPEGWDTENDYRIMCKVRPDLVNPGHSVLFDLKSTRDAAYSKFMKQAKQLGYHFSAAMYLDGTNRCKDFLDHCKVLAFLKFVWICVENEPPFEVACYELSEKDREEGAQLYHTAVRKLHQYQVSDWQGYGEWDGKAVQPITRASDLPRWGNNIV